MYKIIIQKKAKKFIDTLPKPDRIRDCWCNPNDSDIKPLKGHDGLLRLRIAATALSIPLTMDKLIVYVIAANNRGQVYNRD